jgi:hypothetical protein
MAGHKTATLAPTWDCRIPLNVNDSDFRPEMKEPPVVLEKSTDALFAVVRSELGEFVRHAMFHLDFTSPALKPIFQTVQHGLIPEFAGLTTMEEMIEDKYLKFCDAENPLHFMVIWWTRAYLAKCRLLEHHSRYSSPSLRQTDAQRDVAISHAIRMLDCDTKLRTSPLTKRFLWLIHLYFPFPAYIQIVQDLRRRPSSELAEQAWEAMSDNYEAQFIFLCSDSESPFFNVFAKIVLQSWEAREASFSKLGEKLIPPRIVSSIKRRMSLIAQNARLADPQQPNGSMGKRIDEFQTLIGTGTHGLLNRTGDQSGYGPTGPGGYPNMPGLSPLYLDGNHSDWGAMDWGFGAVYPAVWDTEP